MAKGGPNPGSKEAQDQGCKCPIIDNHYGEGVPDGKGGHNFWMVGDCPIHGFKEEQEND
jgi:hypothetical protein